MPSTTTVRPSPNKWLPAAANSWRPVNMELKDEDPAGHRQVGVPIVTREHVRATRRVLLRGTWGLSTATALPCTLTTALPPSCSSRILMPFARSRLIRPPPRRNGQLGDAMETCFRSVANVFFPAHNSLYDEAGWELPSTAQSSVSPHASFRHGRDTAIGQQGDENPTSLRRPPVCSGQPLGLPPQTAAEWKARLGALL